jgi:hypothetical protein
MEQIAKALIKAQSEMSDAKKNAKNPFLKNSYADLNAIREAVIPTLNENKIAVLQPMLEINGEMYVKTLLLHESGETIESITKVVVSKQNDAQSQGSGLTYARRYGLQSLLCVGAVDDDGNASSNLKPELKESSEELELRKLTRLNACATLEELKTVFKSIIDPSKEVIELTNKLKLTLK